MKVPPINWSPIPKRAKFTPARNSIYERLAILTESDRGCVGDQPQNAASVHPLSRGFCLGFAPDTAAAGLRHSRGPFTSWALQIIPLSPSAPFSSFNPFNLFNELVPCNVIS